LQALCSLAAGRVEGYGAWNALMRQLGMDEQAEAPSAEAPTPPPPPAAGVKHTAVELKAEEGARASPAAMRAVSPDDSPPACTHARPVWRLGRAGYISAPAARFGMGRAGSRGGASGGGRAGRTARRRARARRRPRRCA
jgi:hypothetical protein